MAKSKTECNIHATRYIQAVFEKRLREEGFACPNDKLLCWYRVVNGEVLNTLVFRSNWSNLPLMMDITYEITPLFIEPMYIPSVHHNFSTWDRCDLHEFIGLMDFEGGSKPYSDPDILIFVPEKPGGGIDRLNKTILPLFNQVDTIEKCYQFHKSKSMEDVKRWYGKDTEDSSDFVLRADTSREFLDEVIYVGDESIYSSCTELIAKKIELCKRIILSIPKISEEERLATIAELEEQIAHLGKISKADAKQIERLIQSYKKPFTPSEQSIAKAERELAYWQQLSSAFSPGGREEYLEVLEQRKQETIKFLKKKIGIEI